MSFYVPELEYDYGAFGKYISADIMKLHHDVHHQAYVDKLNAAVQQEADLHERTVEDLITNLDVVPESVRTAVRNNGGGHYNHTLFWQCMGPGGSQTPAGELAGALNAKYGSFQAFIDKFSEAATGVFGSGWVWLQPDLEIITTPNQDNPLMLGKAAPILGLDVWEHAYYLDYNAKRADYVKAWWSVVNWEKTLERYTTAQGK
jgi:Fe-Mn family superoxide dismutase